MKEILYVQAGSFANFIGTHFWNTQESYFTYGEDEEPAVYHDRSFREGLTSEGEPTYCPRLLVFDRKSNFGALSKGLYGDDNVSEAPQWSRGVIEYRQDPIPKSVYQNRLAEGEAEDDEDKQSGGDIRFWSDYNRVYLHPRSLQKLPDLAEWEETDGDWNTSRESFKKHEAEHEILDNDVRLFVEECDQLQGIQLMSDTATFGGFTDAFLTALRDELPKIPSLAFPLLSSASYSLASADEQAEAMKAINDALCLCGLESLSTINVPVQHPSTWRKDGWLDGLDIDLRVPYQTSALLSTHIESATLPFRLKTGEYDFSSFNDLLNLSGTTRTTHLSGIYPLPVSASWTPETERRIYDLSAVVEARDGSSTATTYSRVHVSRGLRPTEITKHDELFSAKRPAPWSIHAPAYPTPTSFPAFFAPPRNPTLTATEDKQARHRALSTLTTSSATSKLFASYARLAQECVDRRAEVVLRMGLEFDEVRELKDELWALCDQYAGDDGGEGEDGGEEVGEDEE
ncbi:tubulin nucleotide-binding domain-like protein [Polyporus arcularius HHB13444]|uniref:Tubulin nucleotide-binding domain-like protein n=1 Tax=Polyporus arcularius HHB13444 TaxID=1314778 RepID=A0A5C3NX41_9APHY|nr:tubulin nucleotide-binding domain-like protein [Polyporus arcularius HHB13444]